MSQSPNINHFKPPVPHSLSYLSEAEKSLRIIFAGTPDFAAIALETLLHTTHEVIAIYTQPDKPAGRGRKMTKSPVKILAEKHQIPIYQPISLKAPAEQDFLTTLKPDVIVVAAYGMILPAAVLSIPPLGCINIHPSLLPRWRGAAPIQRTVQAGDTLSGVTIMQMDAGLDTGPILLQYHYMLEPDETSQSLHDKLARMGAEALLEALDLMAAKQIEPTPQDHSLATYAHKIAKEEARIDWQRSAIEIEQDVRAFNPWPGAYTVWQGKQLKIWRALALIQNHTAPQQTILEVTAKGIHIATGDGVLRIQSVQLPGGKIISAHQFYIARQSMLTVGQPFT